MPGHGNRGARGVRLNPAHDDRSRAKIQTSQIVNRLTSFVKGEVEMNAAQVTAALGLLRKTLPDLSQVSGSIDHRHSVEELTDAALIDIAAGRSAGTVAPASGSQEPDQLH